MLGRFVLRVRLAAPSQLPCQSITRQRPPLQRLCFKRGFAESDRPAPMTHSQIRGGCL